MGIANNILDYFKNKNIESAKFIVFPKKQYLINLILSNNTANVKEEGKFE